MAEARAAITAGERAQAIKAVNIHLLTEGDTRNRRNPTSHCCERWPRISNRRPCIIDGKMEGRSVMDMKTQDRQAMPRLRMQFRTTFSFP